MKSAAEQLSTYKSVHLSKKNIATHFIGVPAIIWSLSLLLSLTHWNISLAGMTMTITPAMVFFGASILYYFRLHWRLALGLLLFIIPVVYTTTLVSEHPQALWIAIGVFFIAWVVQFIGHYYEKAKPAFMDDINQLLIGPFFLMAEVYFMCGFEKTLKETITPMAVAKRRSFEAAKKAG